MAVGCIDHEQRIGRRVLAIVRDEVLARAWKAGKPRVREAVVPLEWRRRGQVARLDDQPVVAVHQIEVVTEPPADQHWDVARGPDVLRALIGIQRSKARLLRLKTSRVMDEEAVDLWASDR